MAYVRSLIVPLLSLLAFALLASGQMTAENWFDEGMNLYNLNDFNGSLQAYDRAIEINPQYAEAWNNKGIDLGVLGKYDDALWAFTRAASIDPSYAEAWYNMGMIYDL